MKYSSITDSYQLIAILFQMFCTCIVSQNQKSTNDYLTSKDVRESFIRFIFRNKCSYAIQHILISFSEKRHEFNSLDSTRH